MADAPPGRDYVAAAVAYAKRAASKANRRDFGFWVRLAARRFLNDLERAKKRDAPFYFDAWNAADVCGFIEKLPHVEGTWDSATICLHDSHVLFLVNLFGFRNQDGTRRFTTAVFATARKNAKSTLAAGIGLYCQSCEGENGPQVITGATTGGQARIVFNVAKKMVEKTSALREAFGLEPFANAIASYPNGGSFKPINAKASTQDGLNPSCTVLDEIHAHPNHDLLNVLKSAAGARRNPLWLFLTTEGYENPGPWPEEREFLKKVLLGLIEADHYLAFYFAVDEESLEHDTAEDDDFDERAWRKANPLMDVNPLLLAEIRKAAIDAKEKPGEHAEFKIKRLNRPSSVSHGWVNLTKWRLCGRQIPLSDLHSVPCWGGLDLASTTDLASFRLVWNLDGLLVTHGWRFVPSAAVRRRTQRGLIPFAKWVQSGHLIESGTEAIDYDVVVDTVTQLSERFQIVDVGFDTWNASQTAQKLGEAGIVLESFRQGPQSYHPAMQALEVAYLRGQFAHGNDPVLNWNASNLVAREDQNLNKAPDKRRSPEKIDDMCALLMAVGRSLQGDGMADFLEALRSPVTA